MSFLSVANSITLSVNQCWKLDCFQFLDTMSAAVNTPCAQLLYMHLISVLLGVQLQQVEISGSCYVIFKKNSYFIQLKAFLSLICMSVYHKELLKFNCYKETVAHFIFVASSILFYQCSTNCVLICLLIDIWVAYSLCLLLKLLYEQVLYTSLCITYTFFFDSGKYMHTDSYICLGGCLAFQKNATFSKCSCTVSNPISSL